MYSDNDFLSVLQEARQCGNLAIFVGAGISKNVDAKLPTWSELIDEIKKKVDEKENDYLKLAQLYYLKYGEVEYYNKLKGFFPSHYIEPSDIHKNILGIQPNILITTNWDCLLEYTIEDKVLIYDVITSDKDLVKSNSAKKLIKMHGDFKSHNIVFKEDDYLNYKYNFPLIENYIKSILSTNVVLFLGYSYSDINLKQIIKWIQIHSSSRPSMYLVTHENNYTQQEYLKNHGITTIVLNKGIKGVDWEKYTDNLGSFLKNISSNTFDDNPIYEFRNKLIALEPMASVLPEHILLLINSSFTHYSYIDCILGINNKPLQLLILSSEYTELVNILIDIEKLPNIEEKRREIKSLKLYIVLTHLSKANIQGIKLDPEENGGYRYFSFSENAGIPDNQLNTSFNFDITIKDKSNMSQLLELSLKHYQLGQYTAAIDALDLIVKISSKKRDYFTLYTAVYNFNQIVNLTNYYLCKKEDKPSCTNLKNLINQSCSYNSQQFELMHNIFIDHSYYHHY